MSLVRTAPCMCTCVTHTTSHATSALWLRRNPASAGPDKQSGGYKTLGKYLCASLSWLPAGRSHTSAALLQSATCGDRVRKKVASRTLGEEIQREIAS